MGDLTLSETSLTWLRDVLGAPAVEDDLTRTYTFAHRLNADRELRTERVADDGSNFTWRVAFIDESGNLSLAPIDGAMTCSVEPKAPLRGRLGTGRVAHTESLRLRKTADRRGGFGTRLHQAECDLYRRWLVDEIHVEAVDDGVVFWPAMGFEPNDAAFIQEMYADWELSMGAHAPIVPPKRLAEYPAAFLQSIEWLPLWKRVQ